MARFTLPRDIYHGKGALEALKNFKGKKAIICVGGGSMKKFGFLDRAKAYLEEAGMEVKIFDGIEPDPSVETVMRGADAMFLIPSLDMQTTIKGCAEVQLNDKVILKPGNVDITTQNVDFTRV